MYRNESLDLLRNYVSDKNLILHCIATAAVMKSVASKFSADPNEWEMIGLLHDIDYSLVGQDLKRHGEEGYVILIKSGIPERIAHIVKRHNYYIYNGCYEEPVEIALQAADNASGLIIACALVKQGKLSEVTPSTVKKKFKEKTFAAGCNRDQIKLIEPLLGLEEFYGIAIQGLLSVKDELMLK
jgi:putative nucleotidyltransferase with HDIG domain